ncbi:MAG TPA: hypothetical protein VM686_29235 [Polyangiaceae bacterium]|nr:hypothetical protein [Polyangiaceae bacterium]
MTPEKMLLRAHRDHGCLVVRGPDAKSWLNGVVTCDVKALSEQRGTVGLLLTKQGKIQTDLLLLEGSGSIYLRVAPGLASNVHAELDRMLVMEDAELVDRSAELVFITLHGPQAVELGRAQGALAFGEVDPTGHGGAALVIERERLAALEQGLRELGAGLDSGPEWLALRLDGAWPEFGVDYAQSDNPHEASLDRRAIAWDKGCYLGQEVVCMQDMRGKLKRRVVGVELSGSELPPTGSEVRSAASGEVVGQVTSSGVAARGGLRALAMVKAPFFAPGQELVLGNAAGRVLG